MTTTPDKIWLFKDINERVWIEDPTPQDPEYSTEYIRADLLQDPEWLAANGLAKIEVEGCGNHGCKIKEPTGQGTNGRCRCVVIKEANDD